MDSIGEALLCVLVENCVQLQLNRVNTFEHISCGTHAVGINSKAKMMP